MTIITIKGNEYEICDSWHDVTLQQYAAFIDNIYPTAPEKLKAIWEAEGDKRTDIIAVMQDWEFDQFKPYFAKVLAHFSNAPLDIWNSVPNDLERCYVWLNKNLEEPKQYNYFDGVRLGKDLSFSRLGLCSVKRLKIMSRRRNTKSRYQTKGSRLGLFWQK